MTDLVYKVINNKKYLNCMNMLLYWEFTNTAVQGDAINSIMHNLLRQNMNQLAFKNTFAWYDQGVVKRN